MNVFMVISSCRARWSIVFFPFFVVVIFLYYFDLSAVFVLFFPADDAGIRFSQLTVPYRWLFTRSTIWWCFVIFQCSFRFVPFFFYSYFYFELLTWSVVERFGRSCWLFWYYCWKTPRYGKICVCSNILSRWLMLILYVHNIISSFLLERFALYL